jgi:hypothetical protein
MRRSRPKCGPAAIEAAWRIHDAQADWTGKVDSKAAFALTVHSALLAVAVVLFARLEGWLQFALFGVAAALLVIGAILAASVVAPRLRSRGLQQASRTNYVYFGHARHWRPEELTKRLKRDDMLPQLSRQIVVMADIAWGKHVRVGWAIWLGVAGGIALLAAAVLSQM